MRIEFRSLTAGACVAVAALLSACGSDSTEPKTITIVAPTGVAATAPTNTSVHVTWTQVSGATSYEVDRAVGTGTLASVATGLTGTFYDDNSVQAATSYRYVVRAVNGTTKSVNSTEVSVTTGSPTVPVPTGLTATAASSTSIHLTWTQVAGATSYEIDRAAGNGALASRATGVTGTTYDDNTVLAGTSYRYAIRAVIGTAKSSNSSEVTVATPGAKVATIEAVASSRTLYADTVYTLKGYVKVLNGAILTIQPGTKIVGDTTTPGSSLWVMRGAKLMAEGTAAAPIVFTSARSAGNRRPGDWGGILIIGNAKINRTATSVLTEGPPNVGENYAGGTDDADNSGSLKYVRIEFAGYDVSGGAGQELNSISSYAVGSGTTYDYIESVAGLDDSFEFFGGKVDMRHMLSWESGDDHFDWTEGYQGRGQYLIALQTALIQPRTGTGVVSSDPRGFEGDGCEVAKAGCVETNTPYSVPVFANFTVIGPGAGVFTATDGNGAVIRRGSGGTFVNGIIGRWPGIGISVRDATTKALFDVDSLYFRNIILAENGLSTGGIVNFEAPGTNFGSLLSTNATAWAISEATLANIFSGALPTSATTVTTANINLTPTGAAATGGTGATLPALIAARTANFFGAAMPGTDYVGAVEPGAGAKWYDGWTVFIRN